MFSILQPLSVRDNASHSLPSLINIRQKSASFFTRIEFDDAASRIIRYVYPEQFTLDREAEDYLFSLTNGHPGGLSSMMSYIYHVRSVLHPSLNVVRFLWAGSNG